MISKQPAPRTVTELFERVDVLTRWKKHLTLWIGFDEIFVSRSWGSGLGFLVLRLILIPVPLQTRNADISTALARGKHSRSGLVRGWHSSSTQLWRNYSAITILCLTRGRVGEF